MLRHALRLTFGLSLLALSVGLIAPSQANASDDWLSNVFTGSGAKGPPSAARQGKSAGDRKGAKRSRATLHADADGSIPPPGTVGTPPPRNLLPRPHLPRGRGKWQWHVRKTEWSKGDEDRFGAFVTAIGESDCKTVHDCITSAAANPTYHAKNPPHVKFYSDCADLPYFLRAYFAFYNDLPFSFSVRYSAHPKTPGSTPKVHGNKITERFDIVGPGPDGRIAIATVGRFVSTEHFRTPPQYNAKHLPDHYPVKLTRDSIKPGTVIFDPDGHIAIVYKVTENGRIHYIDSHPDNSLTRGVYARDFARADPQMGAGFKRWRPQKLVGAKKNSDGTLSGGRIVLAPDTELADWSDEQFFGNTGRKSATWADGKFVIDGREVDYYDYLRLRLARPGFKYDPIDEVRTSIKGLCDDLRYRTQAVDYAVAARLHLRPQPPKLPNNIYATTGDWELYSTPSRDARLKTSFIELRDETERFLALHKANSPLLTFDGADLRAALLAAYKAESSTCDITYTKSDGTTKTLEFEEVRKRLFLLSFDPHHCVERRWGASEPDELASCNDDAVKAAWYTAQDRLRFQFTRTYGEQMGWTLAQLQNRKLDIGIPEPPEVDTLEVLAKGHEVAATDIDVH